MNARGRTALLLLGGPALALVVTACAQGNEVPLSIVGSGSLPAGGPAAATNAAAATAPLSSPAASRTATTSGSSDAGTKAAAAGKGAAAAAASSSGSHWVPAQATRLQYQLQADSTGAGAVGGIDVGICEKPASGGSCVTPGAYDIDLYAPDGTTPNAAAVSAIHAAGAKAICYVDAGSWENWRPDASAFPASVKGSDMQGWPGEKWLDIRATSVLLPIITARVAKCQTAGFDAVEFDNVDGYKNSTGFPLTAAEQVTYDEDLASIAHGHGMAAGLKNDLDQVSTLVGDFDFSLDEECSYYSECSKLDPFLTAGKAVFEVEYTDDGVTTDDFCAAADSAGRSAILKSLNLSASPWTPCR